MQFIDTIYGSRSTVKTYKCLFNKHILPYIPEETASQFTELDLINLMRSVKWKDLHPRTVKMLLTILGNYLKHHGVILDFKRIKSSVSRSIPLDTVKALTKAELDLLLAKAETDDAELYEIILFAVYTGARKGEIFGLEVRDLDLANKRVCFQRSYDDPYTKGRSPRVVQLSDIVISMLEKRKINTELRKAKVFRRFDPNPRLAIMCRKAGINVISIHALRHTFATLALESKKSIKQVQGALGHKSVTTTLNTYWNITGETFEVDFL